MDRVPGTYVLVLRALQPRAVRVGKAGRLDVVPGYYLYVGSAFGPGGVAARVKRHLRGRKALHWHIDYLSWATRCECTWYTYDPVRREHEWARSLAGVPQLTIPMKGFGCSDCCCESHLFFSRSRPPSDWIRRALGGVSGINVVGEFPSA